MQASLEVRSKIQETCTKISTESGKALQELSIAVKEMRQPSSADTHIENAKAAAKNLNSLLKSGPWEDINLLQVIPVVTVASLLIDLVNCTEKLADSIFELASKAHFNKPDHTVSPEKLSATVKSSPNVDCRHVVINIDQTPTPEILEEENSSAANTCIVKSVRA